LKLLLQKDKLNLVDRLSFSEAKQQKVMKKDCGLDNIKPTTSKKKYEDILIRTTILTKNDMIGLLSLKTAPFGGAICRVDPREAKPAIQVYSDPEQAEECFIRSLKTTRENGWKIVYDGLPLHG
jgi:hypothetical protein